jgi:uncharacterized membrane protein YoaK (UPF0700 family)
MTGNVTQLVIDLVDLARASAAGHAVAAVEIPLARAGLWPGAIHGALAPPVGRLYALLLPVAILGRADAAVVLIPLPASTADDARRRMA